MPHRDKEDLRETAPYPARMDETKELSAHDWEHDAQLLSSLAYLSGTRPYALLRKVSWSVGGNRDAESFLLRQPLSARTRNRLQGLLDERLHREREIIENCCHESAQITQFIPYALALLLMLLIIH